MTRAALLPLAAGAGAAPTLLFPGLEGDASAFAPLAARWPGPGPLWALQPRGAADDHLPWRRVESIAADLLQHVADRWSDGALDRWSKHPFLLAGWSFGGLLAWELGWTMARAGASVHVALLDTRALLGEPATAPLTTAVEAAHAEALRRYQPPPGDLPLTVFCARPWPDDDALGWRALQPQATVTRVDADHVGLLRSPDVAARLAALAQGLSR